MEFECPHFHRLNIFRYSHDKLYVKMKETVDTFQNLYQVRNVSEITLPDNHMDRFEKQRFNMVKTGFIDTFFQFVSVFSCSSLLHKIFCWSFYFFIFLMFFILPLQLSNELISFFIFFFFSPTKTERCVFVSLSGFIDT